MVLLVVPIFPGEARYEVESSEVVQLFTEFYRATVAVRNTDDFGGIFQITDQIYTYAHTDLQNTSLRWTTLTMSGYIGPSGDTVTGSVTAVFIIRSGLQES